MKPQVSSSSIFRHRGISSLKASISLTHSHILYSHVLKNQGEYFKKLTFVDNPCIKIKSILWLLFSRTYNRNIKLTNFPIDRYLFPPKYFLFDLFRLDTQYMYSCTNVFLLSIESKYLCLPMMNSLANISNTVHETHFER